MVVLLFSLFVLCYGETFKDLTRQKRQIDKIQDLSNAVFTPIDNKQEGATELSTPPPWIAQVKPTVPLLVEGFMMCTAVCVKQHIFITASRCLVTLRVPFTVVGYQEVELPAKAFVRASTNTKQMYNDISFVITVSNSTPPKWQPIKIADHGSWSEDYEDNANVVGYVGELGEGKETTKKMSYKLYELTVKVSTAVCETLLNQQYHRVPCFFYCTVQEHSQSKLNCQKYLRGLGHVVVQKQEGKELLLGITTWAVIEKEALPVGFAVPHTDAFIFNINCAEKIASDTSEVMDSSADHYNRLCNTGIPTWDPFD